MKNLTTILLLLTMPLATALARPPMTQAQVERCVSLLQAATELRTTAIGIGSAVVLLYVREYHPRGKALSDAVLALSREPAQFAASTATAEHHRAASMEAEAELQRYTGCPTLPAGADAALIAGAAMALAALPEAKGEEAPPTDCGRVRQAVRALEHRAYLFAVRSHAALFMVAARASPDLTDWPAVDRLIRDAEEMRTPPLIDAELHDSLHGAHAAIAAVTLCPLSVPGATAGGAR